MTTELAAISMSAREMEETFVQEFVGTQLEVTSAIALKDLILSMIIIALVRMTNISNFITFNNLIKDIDECKDSDACVGENDFCLNTFGSFKCFERKCSPGYRYSER